MHRDAPIIQKTYDFYKAFYATVRLFPNEEKYAIGGKIKNTILEILELLIEAGFRKTEKIPLLEKASIKLDSLKIFIRLTYEIKLINQKKYIQLEEPLQEIGRMLGGWIRSCKTHNPA